ncbi:DNA primase family protein [Streptomyces stelliscabiei]|uniref:Putative DNA primase/helicase n=1 Tax=Streptomyces stelliscabiei TaxID=146820 RepID=A0A8I0P8D8_9ACTN|nr:phage/plasmid primase, P4 family [Streptomyces stelliscabiei]MBE1597123.1 putative DNA primase/helicase [Streptomyces stelliscabiei]
MTDFNDTYWARTAKDINVSHEVRHANFAKFVAEHSAHSLKFVTGLGWYRWTGKIWAPTGDEGAALQAITEASDVLIQRMRDSEDDRGWAGAAVGKMLNGRERSVIVREMAARPEFRATVDDFDTARHLLTFPNGTVDLRTGELRSHDPADMLTLCALVDYVPDALAPRWERFIEEIFPGKPDVQSYYQRLLGLCITGEVRDHVLGVWYGSQGRNGKGTTVRTMQAAFGPEIVREVDFGLYEGGRGREPHTEQLAALRGARMVVAQEGEADVPMNTARLKRHTGGDRIQARHLYGREFTFAPTFTLVLATNHLPEFSAGGAALWARTKAILFGESFTGDRVDPALEPTIQGPEVEGFAAWVVRGAVAYYAAGRLADIDEVTQATEMHKAEVDPLRALVGDLFEYDEGCEVSRTAFNGALKEWREANGDKSAKYSPSSVKKHLLNRGITERRTKGAGWVYGGIRFPDDRPSDTAQRDDGVSDIFGQPLSA